MVIGEQSQNKVALETEVAKPAISAHTSNTVAAHTRVALEPPPPFAFTPENSTLSSPDVFNFLHSRATFFVMSQFVSEIGSNISGVSWYAQIGC
jgi:hypothetical protein